MNRRAVLAGVGSALTLSLAGCQAVTGSESGEAPNDPVTDPPKPLSEYPTATGELDEFDPEGTYRSVSVGTRDGVPDDFRPHDVTVWNAAGYPETVVEVVDYGARTRPLDRTFEVSDGAALSVSLREPAPYLVTVRVPDVDAEQTLAVPCLFFDCNSSGTQIGLFEDGRIESTVGSTLAGCPSPTCLPSVGV